MTNKDQIKAIAWEFKWDEKKLIEKLADEKMPEFVHREEFKEKLDTKIQNQINITKKQRIEQAVMDSVPKKIKMEILSYVILICCCKFFGIIFNMILYKYFYRNPKSTY